MLNVLSDFLKELGWWLFTGAALCVLLALTAQRRWYIGRCFHRKWIDLRQLTKQGMNRLYRIIVSTSVGVLVFASIVHAVAKMPEDSSAMTLYAFVYLFLPCIPESAYLAWKKAEALLFWISVVFICLLSTVLVAGLLAFLYLLFVSFL